MLKSVDEHRLAAELHHEEKQLKVKIAVRGSFVLNCVLACLQIYGATSSLSYSLFATMADSIFDPFSNITLWITHRAAKKINEAKYPAVQHPRPLYS
jgi:divalent metal cation (Fe/Co/Zn/Cd) transporter